MQGNTYISLNESTYESLIPEALEANHALVDEYDTKIPTTFKQLGQANERVYGPVLPLTYADEKYYLLELSASWKNGEMTALLSLGAGLAYPENTLLNIQEAIEFVQSTQPNLTQNEQ